VIGQTSSDVSSSRARSDFGAEGSVRRGLDALLDGDRVFASAWFGRASRLAGSDPLARLLLASTLADKDDTTALKLFLRIVDEDDLPEAHFGIAAIRLRRGETAAAAVGLQEMLRRLTPLPARGFTDTATAVAHAVGVPGWVGLRPDGRLLVGLVLDATPHLEIHVGRRRVVVPDSVLRAEMPLILTLPSGWARRGVITAVSAGAPLLGSPISPTPFCRAIGFVEAYKGGLRGWAVLPASPGSGAELTVISAAVAARTRRVLRISASVPDMMAGAPRGALGFVLARSALPAEGPLSVLGPDGEPLTGSPLDPGAETRAAASAAAALSAVAPGPTSGGTAPRSLSTRATPEGRARLDAWRPLPADLPMLPRPPYRARAGGGCSRGVVVIIPIYRGATEFLACLASVLADLTAVLRIVVVDDASPDPELRDVATAAAMQGDIELIRLERNLGFPGAANAGLRRAAGYDAILLNSDTLVPPRWIERLRAAAASAPDIGSATPLSNDATILSYPDARGANPIPDADAALRFDLACRTANPGCTLDIPSGVGFCMLLRHDCLEEVGLLREDAFAQGYGEENDWCLRARRLGWRHVAALDLFVAHVGGRSFGPAKASLTKHNGRILNRLHPGYDALIGAFIARDPLAVARRRIDEVRWIRNRTSAGAIVMIGHGCGGGVDRHLRERAAAIAALGLRPVMIEPVPDDENGDQNGTTGLRCILSDGRPEAGDGPYPNLSFTLPDEIDALVALLRTEQTRRVEIHHLLGHAPEVARLSELLGVPMVVHIHDYAWLCPRISLLGREGHHCSEPAPVACGECVDDLGVPRGMPREATVLRQRSAATLERAGRVLVSCQDAADRIRRHFPVIIPEIRPWEAQLGLAERSSTPAVSPRDSVATIGLVGAIGPEKGYEVLLACARNAALRSLPLRFVLVGYSNDDDRLLRTGRVFVTGRFAEGEATELLHSHGADIGFVPSVIPETWCYALSELRCAGLRVAAFDLGAQAERIRADEDGFLLPLGADPAAINGALLHDFHLVDRKKLEPILSLV
jgi:GT2 family glycosyltransferase/glycosyltransferase involved in cell wall biosynthesis